MGGAIHITHGYIQASTLHLPNRRLQGARYYRDLVTVTGTENLMLAVHAVGLATVFVGVFDEEKLGDLLEIPPGIRIVGLFPVGYAQTEAKAGPPRKPLEEIVYYEKWKE